MKAFSGSCTGGIETLTRVDTRDEGLRHLTTRCRRVESTVKGGDSTIQANEITSTLSEIEK